MQAELHRVLYPLFIHIYIKLTACKAGSQASQFIAQHQKRFSQEGSSAADTRAQVTSTRQRVTAVCSRGRSDP